MKSLASIVTLVLFLLLPALSSGGGLPPFERDVLLEGTVEAVSWPYVTILTRDGGTVRVSIPYNTRTFLAGDEIELYASCPGDGADCKFSSWGTEFETPEYQGASIPPGPALRERPASQQEGVETEGTVDPYRYHHLTSYDYGFIYRASKDASFTKVPPSRATGGYFQWSGTISQVMIGHDDRVYIVSNPDFGSGFAFTHIKKADGALNELGTVTVVGKYKANWVYTMDGRKIMMPLLYDCHVSSQGKKL